MFWFCRPKIVGSKTPNPRVNHITFSPYGKRYVQTPHERRIKEWFRENIGSIILLPVVLAIPTIIVVSVILSLFGIEGWWE